MDGWMDGLTVRDPLPPPAGTGLPQGVYNNGWDDENYDYVLEKEEVLLGRYVVKNRIGKGKHKQARASVALPCVFGPVGLEAG